MRVLLLPLVGGDMRVCVVWCVCVCGGWSSGITGLSLA